MTKGHGMRTKLAYCLAGAALLAAAGCSRETEEPTESNVTVELPVTEPDPPEREVVPPPPANSVENLSANVAEALEEPVAPDQQMLEDADATGMTARMPPQAEDGNPPEGSGAQ